ncbi:MAG: beta-N-acetylhexosaminidase [Wenzhouxiangellaceae bacterium]
MTDSERNTDCQPGPLMIGLASTTLADHERDSLQHPWVGGVTLFSRNFQAPTQLTELCQAIREARPGPLLLAVDHEGGRVQRLRNGFTRLPPLAVYGRLYEESPTRGLDHAYRHARVTAGELLAHGLDLAFAPVLDLERGSEVIGDRAFHADPQVVSALGKAFIAGLHDGGMAAVGKHYPGHGSVREDSHHCLVSDCRDSAALEADLQPFRELAPELDGLMMAHVCYPAVDEQPAGFSTRWIGERLRRQWDYQGVVISDDLGMLGAAGVGGLDARLQLALDSGCDLALICAAAESCELLAALEQRPAPDASVAVKALAGRQQPDLTEYERVSEWRQWRVQLEALANV